ncbi:MAG: DUF523 domain-containing protein [Desulfobulbaceae bacterium]|nr:MAG: DUF523 domain-containing protein [Desulfobulbaceae bacterium]
MRIVMQILVSACLVGRKVRYNGLSIVLQSVWLDELRQAKKVYAFCPEIAGGLSVPRPCAEITGGNGRDVLDGRATVVDTEGRYLTDIFLLGARKTLEICREKSIFVAILTEGSPSCGSNLQYDGTFSGKKIRGCGVTAALLAENGIRVFSQHQLAEAADFLGGLQVV